MIRTNLARKRELRLPLAAPRRRCRHSTASTMKRAHGDISPPATNGDLQSNALEPVVAENGAAKSEGQGSAAAAVAGQSSAAAAAAPAAAAATTAAVAGAAAASQQRKKCPYLDTINRNVLDFDFEKVWDNTAALLGCYCPEGAIALSAPRH